MHYAFIPDNPTQFKLCQLEMASVVENTLEREKEEEGGALMSFASQVCVCDHKVSLMRPFCMHCPQKVGLRLIPAEPRRSLSTATEILQREKESEQKTFRPNKRLTSAAFPPWTLHLVLPSRRTFDFHTYFLFEGTWKDDVRRTAVFRNIQFIYIICSKLQLMLALSK